MHDTNAPPGDLRPRGKPRPRTRGVFEKVPGSEVWYVRYQDHTGKIRKKMIGPKALAIRAYKKFAGQVAEKRVFPDPGKLKGTKRQRGPASPTTVNKELSFARAVFYDFLAALEDRGLSSIPNPVRQDRRHSGKDPFVSEPTHRTRHLGEDEERRLRATLSAETWPVVAFSLLSGLDRGAQLALRWEAVDLQTRTINTERRKGQRGQSRALTLPINGDLLAILRALPSRLTSPWVFPNAAGTAPLDGRVFDRLVFRPALKRAGIKDFRWKDLRHTFATRLRMGNVEIQSIRDLLGHTSTRMTERYSHATHTHLRAAVDKVALTSLVADDASPRDPATDPAPVEERTQAKTA